MTCPPKEDQPLKKIYGTLFIHLNNIFCQVGYPILHNDQSIRGTSVWFYLKMLKFRIQSVSDNNKRFSSKWKSLNMVKTCDSNQIKSKMLYFKILRLDSNIESKS